MQTPFVHVSVALQHGVLVEQVWFVSAHTKVGAVHVPLVAPAGMEQEVPAQQSGSTVHVAPAAWQELPPVPVHDPPNGWHAGAALPPHFSVPVASGAHASLLQH